MPITFHPLLRIVLITAACSLLAFAQTDARLLEAEKPIERELAGGETHAYKISLSAGQYLHVVAEQRGIDVVVSLHSPAGKKIFEVDSPNGSKGPEPVWALAETDGEYRLEIHSPDKKAPAGRYEVAVKEMRAGVSEDKYFVEAQREMATAADLIFGERTANARAKAKQNFENAARLFRQMENKERRASALAKTGRVAFSWLGDSEMSLLFLLEALPLFEETGKKSEAAFALLEIGSIFSSEYKYKTAIDNFGRALALATEVNDKPLQILVLNEMGMAYTMIGNLPVGLRVFSDSLRIGEEIGSKRSIATANKNIGLVYQKLGNYARSLEYLEKDLAIWRELGEKNNIPAALLNIGNIYYHQSNYDLAIDYYQRALAGFEAMPSRSGIIFALDNMGSAYLNSGRYAEALAAFQKAQQTRRGSFLKDPTSILNIGLIYREQGKYDEALAYLEKAMPLAEKADVPSFMVDILNGMSGVYYAKGDFQKALELSQRATRIVDEGVYPEGYLQTLIREGNANLALNKLKEARATFEKAVARVEGDRQQIVGGEEDQLQYFESKTAPYEALIAISIAEGKSNEAFGYAEKIKSRALLDVLQNGRNDIRKAMTAAQIETETRLRSELTALNNRLGGLRETNADPASIAAASKELKAKRLEFEDFKVRLYAAHPQLKIQRGEMNSISLQEAGKLLPNTQSALLEFVVATDKTFLFVLTKEPKLTDVSIKVYPIDVKRKDLIEKTEKFRSRLAKGDLDFQKPSRELYDLLLKPAQEQIAGKTNLIVVPDGVLWDLPFQALQNPQNAYLIEAAALSYAPSLTALREMTKKTKGKKSDSTYELLGFGNPVIGKETKARVKQVFMSENLEPIPEAERLVNALGKLYGTNRSRIYTGAEAQESVAKADSPKYRVVQFATHGIFNNRNPMYSYLLLARKNEDSNEDGLLEAWEMKDLNLNADLVILSACETARGKVSNGEGVIGMSWALFIAGTPTTVASQWKVESSSTTELMLEFHRQLLTGKNITKAEALRRASLKLMKMPQYKHPSYWAGFVMVGDGF